MVRAAGESSPFGRWRPGGRPILIPACPQRGPARVALRGAGGGAAQVDRPEAPVSHAAVVDDVLLCLAVVLTLLLAAFIGAVIRAPAQPATKPAPAGPAPATAAPEPAPKLPVRKPGASAGPRPPASASPARAHGP